MPLRTTPLCGVCVVCQPLVTHDAAQRWKTLTGRCMIAPAAVEKSFGTPSGIHFVPDVLLIFGVSQGLAASEATQVIGR